MDVVVWVRTIVLLAAPPHLTQQLRRGCRCVCMRLCTLPLLL